MQDRYDEVFQFIRSVPSGKVVTYGQVAECIESGGVTARMVGAFLRSSPENVPWHRVVGAGGKYSVGKIDPALAVLQKTRLSEEGVSFKRNGDVDMVVSQYEAP